MISNLKYIATEFPEVDSNLYVFWEKNCKLFPNLSRVAKKLLSIPASSAENERCFSHLRRQLSDERESLGANTINALFISRSFSDML